MREIDSRETRQTRRVSSLCGSTSVAVTTNRSREFMTRDELYTEDRATICVRVKAYEYNENIRNSTQTKLPTTVEGQSDNGIML